MVDSLSIEARSALMRRIKGKDTKPEMAVRRLVHGMGYRYRLHRKGLAGKPDLVFPARRKAIFVHGCFWHAHGCRIGQPPKSRQDFWLPKLQANRDRDARNVAALLTLGWKVLTVWQCQTRDPDSLAEVLSEFLGPPRKIRSTRCVPPRMVAMHHPKASGNYLP